MTPWAGPVTGSGHCDRSAGPGRHNDGVDARNTAADLVATIDRRAPGIIRFLAGTRWGGLRTVEPDPIGWVAVAAAGTAGGIAARRLLGRVAGRPRPSVPVAAATGGALAWFCLWRWDTARWRRTHVSIVVELPDDLADRLVEDLRDRGLEVSRWEAGHRAGTRAAGLTCRSRDLRAVNAAVDEVLRGGSELADDREAADAVGG
jgi:hypothetical protein